MTINVSADKLFIHLQFLLILIILGLLLWSKPWDTSSSTATTRTITVSGESTIDAVPDEFVFYPYFEMRGEDQEELKTALNEKANQAVEKLKELGISEDKIELNASSYDRWYWDVDEEGVLTVSLTVTVDNKEKAQEVQDYLLTLDIKGQLTPQATFSKSKKKELDAKAVEEASKEARTKAETQANLFGAKLGDVVKVEQGSDSIFPIAYDGVQTLEAAPEDTASSSLPVLPGEDEYSQTVVVTYELK